MVKIGIVQPEIKDWDIKNTGPQAIEYLKYFEKNPVDLIVFPEYFPGWHVPLIDTIKKIKSYVIIGETLKSQNSNFLNAATLISPEGKVIGQQIKNKLMPDEINKLGYEPGTTYEVFSTKFGKIGMQICYDFPINPEGVTIQALKGADLIVVIACAVKPLIEHWKHIITTRSIDNGIPIVFSNVGGTFVGTDGADYGGGFSRIVVPVTSQIWSLDDFLNCKTITPEKLVEKTLNEEPGILIHEINLDQYKKYREDVFKMRDCQKLNLK
ncbi:MAG: carbon-nitrogen hydrolase family protein [Promethearchaeota archaeon]